MADKTYAIFSDLLNSKDGKGGADKLDGSDASNSIKITRLSHAIIDLLAITPADATNVPGAKDAYIDGLTSALSALWGADKDKTRVLEVSDAPFPDATGNSGGRSSRQTRRRRNGGKRNQRR